MSSTLPALYMHAPTLSSGLKERCSFAASQSAIFSTRFASEYDASRIWKHDIVDQKIPEQCVLSGSRERNI